MNNNSASKTYRSNGKLLLSGEYVVLDGAKALAVPTTFGQSLTIEPEASNTIVWKSYNELGEIWFDDVFSFADASTALNIKSVKTNEILKPIQSDSSISERLVQILKAAQGLNPEFLSSNQGYTISTNQDFNRLWGLGTSSTLINNIAQWAQVDPYQLLKQTFGGSGYDIACARHNTPITYQLLDAESQPLVNPAAFHPNFKDQLYFVYLNQKQNSRAGIVAYKKNATLSPEIIHEIGAITEAMISCESLLEFEKLIMQHEDLISKLIQQDPIKSHLFSDYTGAIKSLGAWGGDFVLATSEINPIPYFQSKGFHTVIPYKQMVLN